MQNSPPKYLKERYTISELADELGLHHHTVARLIGRPGVDGWPDFCSEFPNAQKSDSSPTSQWLVPAADVKAFKARQVLGLFPVGYAGDVSNITSVSSLKRNDEGYIKPLPDHVTLPEIDQASAIYDLPFLTWTEAAKKLQCSDATLRQYLAFDGDTGRPSVGSHLPNAYRSIAASKTSQIRIPASDVEQLLLKIMTGEVKPVSRRKRLRLAEAV